MTEHRCAPLDDAQRRQSAAIYEHLPPLIAGLTGKEIKDSEGQLAFDNTQVLNLGNGWHELRISFRDPPPLTKEQLCAMMREPRYWRDRDPELVKVIIDGFRRLYPRMERQGGDPGRRRPGPNLPVGAPAPAPISLDNIVSETLRAEMALFADTPCGAIGLANRFAAAVQVALAPLEASRAELLAALIEMDETFGDCGTKANDRARAAIATAQGRTPE